MLNGASAQQAMGLPRRLSQLEHLSLSDIARGKLVAFDDAIRDGVHILSLSLGPDSPQGDYFNDAIFIGSFHATTHGVLVVASAGNEGNQGSATNLAPWMITVSP